MSEKTRTRVAKQIIKNTKLETYTGYKKINDNEIILTDGNIAYIGEPIQDIPEVCLPERYYEENIIKYFNFDFKNEFEFDLEQIKEYLKQAKSEYGNKKNLHQLSDKAKVLFEKDYRKAYFQSKLIIQACDLVENIDGKIKIYYQSKSPNSPIIKYAVAFIEGEKGKCIIMSLR